MYSHTYNTIISLENLLFAWKEFRHGKRKRHDVQLFERNLVVNIQLLHERLVTKIYSHSSYEAFNISDPKPRNIHKASVRDRIVHHLLYSALYPYFDTKFIHDSYSCRVGKGTHRALRRFERFGRKVSRNDTRTCWVLKCDIRKFFASIDHTILKEILARHIYDTDMLWLLGQIIDSFPNGLPLGNLTSQLLVNVYMNECDHFVKHTLKMKYYIRYADDFVFFSHDRKELETLLPKVERFLKEQLALSLHPDKVFIKTLASGVDFLGWVHFLTHHVLRTATKRRMLKRITTHPTVATIASYKGMLEQGNGYKLSKKLYV
ncbi:group II intron reverse transcriptase domain-containing protein [Candidatus Nomurabacteria bacterium]|nr:group II intron reverse transcriptase domain-containing protein [Candidatus Nomurabacteria bacterium]